MSSNPEKISIFVNGVEYKVRRDIPLGAALYEVGIYSLEKSMRFSRPRGLMVFGWNGPEKVYIENDFEANPYLVRPKEGMRVRLNLKPPFPRSFINLLKGYFRVGGYNKWPFNRLWAWNIALKYIDEILPWNELVLSKSPPKNYPSIKRVDSDILVIGGGLGGLSAAVAAARTGAKVVLIDAEDTVGGHLLLINREEGNKVLNNLRKEAKELNIEIINNLIFEGFFEDTAFGYKIDGEYLVKFNYKAVVFATGSYEVPALYENNDLPRTFLVSAVLRLLRYGVKPGREGVVLGSTDRAFETALFLRKNGIDVTVIESSFQGPKYEFLKERLVDKGIEVIDKVTSLAALGSEYVEKIRINVEGDTKVIKSDFIVNAPYIMPEVELVRMAKVDLAFDILLGGFIPVHSFDGSTHIDNVFIAGSVGGIIPEEIYQKLALLTGFKAAEYIGYNLPNEYDNILSEAINDLKNNYSKYYNALNRLDNSFSSHTKYEYYDNSHPTFYGGEYDNIYICFCTDVTLKDLLHVSEDMGLNIMEHIKRYSGIGTGRCQGRRCTLNTILTLSKFASRKPSQVGTIRCRPPYIPVPLYLFGGEEE